MELKSVNNTSFQAKLDITKVKTNKARWENIAKTFNENTKDISGRIKVSEDKYDTVIRSCGYRNITAPDDIIAAAYNKTIESLLAKYDDNTVVKKLIKLLNIGSVATSRKAKALEKYYKKEYYESKSPEVTLKENYDSIKDIATNKTNKDAFWRNFEIIL